MKVSGKKTTTENVMIDVDKDDLFRQLERLVVQKCPSLGSDNYIDKDGFLWVYEYTHPHNNDDVYNKTRQATGEEEKWASWLGNLKSILNL